jgi:hypothetical protein
LTIKLRAHHLLCFLTYAGKGYSPSFTANYDRIADRIGKGEDILIVSGPDDICVPLLSEDDPHCLRDGIVERDRHAAHALAPLLSRRIEPGEQLNLDADAVGRLRTAFTDGGIRKACSDCEWLKLCTDIASDGFRNTRLG